jgi:PAS domain S-box-containing protein
MDYFQYQVAKIWYQMYWAITLAFNIAIFALYIAAHLLPSIADYVGTFGLSHSVLIICGLNLIYLCLLYWFISRRSLMLGVLIASMLFAITALNGMANTVHSSGIYLYMAGWLVSMFMAGTYGIPLLMGSILLTFTYVCLQSDFRPGSLVKSSLVLVASSLIAAIAAYFFWKNRFVNTQEQKVTELSGMLRSNQKQSEILLHSIADGIIVTNTEGKITLINPAAAAMAEWPVDEATGVDVQLVAKLHKEDGSDINERDNPFSLVLEQEQYVSQTLEITGRNGRKLIISLVASPVLVPGTNKPVGVVAALRDISQEKLAEKQRSDFISTASHEMRTPVAAIEGYLALALNDKVSTLDSRARSYLEKAHSSTQNLGRLFQDLLTSSKAEDGRLSSHPSVIDMGAFTQQVTEDLKFAAEKKGLIAEFIVGDSGKTVDATAKDASAQHLLKPLYYVYADSERIREVITNLFDNACKYTDNGKISIGLTGNSEVVQLYVRDTGSGISAYDIPHLFQKFYRVDNSATRTIGGTGLGLFICRKIVELYHGRIWAESEVGKGSTFFINLPRLTVQKAMELQSSSANSSTSNVISPSSMNS